MLIAYGSDIHSEFEDQKVVSLEQSCDVLILAGDIAKAKNLAKYAEQYLDKAAHVVAVLGNHEIWGEELNRAAEKAKEANTSDRIHILANDIVEIDGWKFIGTTAWTDFKYGNNDRYSHMLMAVDQVKDYKKIRKFNGAVYRKLKPEDTERENEKAKAFIFQEITSQSVVVTHHAPTFLSISEEYKDNNNNSCYVSNWGNDIAYSDGPKLWFHGHIHTPSDYMVGDTRILCNPVGYPGQIPGSGFKYIEI